MTRPWKSRGGTSLGTPFRDGKPDIAAGGFVEPRGVANESLELSESPILSAAIDIKDAHQTPLPEGPAGFPSGEHLRSFADAQGADGAVAGATVEVHRTPPIKSSAKQ